MVDRYVPLVITTSRSFPHSWIITGFVTRLTWRVPLVEQEQLNLPEHLNLPPIFSEVRVTRSLVLCLCFVDLYLSFYPFSFVYCVVWPSFPHSWLNFGFVTRVIGRVALVEQELVTFPERLCSPPVFSGIRVARSLVFCAVFCR
jgi:hypothetical protein